MNAIVVDIKGRYAAVLDTDGNVVKILNARYEIGQKIRLKEAAHRKALSGRRIASVAIAAALALTIGTGTAYAMPYGTVNLDAESQIEYTINRFDRVLSVKALNEEGEAVLTAVDENSLRHHSIEQAIALTVEQLEESGYLAREDTSIQVTANTGSKHHTERLQQQLDQRITDSLPPMPKLESAPWQDPGQTSPGSPPAVIQRETDSFSTLPGESDSGTSHGEIPGQGSYPETTGEAVMNGRLDNDPVFGEGATQPGEMIPEMEVQEQFDMNPPPQHFSGAETDVGQVPFEHSPEFSEKAPAFSGKADMIAEPSFSDMMPENSE